MLIFSFPLLHLHSGLFPSLLNGTYINTEQYRDEHDIYSKTTTHEPFLVLHIYQMVLFSAGRISQGVQACVLHCPLDTFTSGYLYSVSKEEGFQLDVALGSAQL